MPRLRAGWTLEARSLWAGDGLGERFLEAWCCHPELGLSPRASLRVSRTTAPTVGRAGGPIGAPESGVWVQEDGQLPRSFSESHLCLPCRSGGSPWPARGQ